MSPLRYVSNSSCLIKPRYGGWLAQQTQSGASGTEQEGWWLDRIADVVATPAGVSAGDREDAPITECGGVDGVLVDLGGGATGYLGHLKSELTT